LVAGIFCDAYLSWVVLVDMRKFCGLILMQNSSRKNFSIFSQFCPGFHQLSWLENFLDVMGFIYIRESILPGFMSLVGRGYEEFGTSFLNRLSQADFMRVP
jgi:hypothetical protein